MYELCLILHAICVNAHAPFSIDFDVYDLLYCVYGHDLCLLGRLLICYISIHFSIGVLHASVTTVVYMDLHAHVHVYHVSYQNRCSHTFSV